MQTQCPHCQTLFHVTDEQLQVADAQVRCGQCNEVFTADIIATPEAPMLNEVKDLDLNIDELSINTFSSFDEIQLDVVNIEIPELDLPELEKDEILEPDIPNQPSLRLINTDKPLGNDDYIHQAELSPIRVNSLAINTTIDAANTEHEVTEPQDTIITDDTTDLSHDGYDTSQLYPELKTLPAILTPMPISYILISAVLILLFAGQSIYLLRDKLASHGLRPLMQHLCANLNCDLALPRAPNHVVLKNREIRSHPSIKNALSVKAIINNQASFRQAYPLLQIQFHDVKGRIVAGRDFLPREYLPDDINIKKGITPNNPVNIALELIDPGKNAVSFLFIFK